MGAGKTTVGRLLAERWRPLRDTDRDVEAVEGRTVADIFVDSGEAHFRELERAAVAGRWPTTTACWRSAGERCSTRHPRAARRAPGRLPPGRALRRREAGRARRLAAAAARQRARPDQGSCSTSARPVYESVATARRRHRRAGRRRGRRRGRGSCAMAESVDRPRSASPRAAPYDVVVGPASSTELPAVLGDAPGASAGAPSTLADARRRGRALLGARGLDLALPDG